MCMVSFTDRESMFSDSIFFGDENMDAESVYIDNDDEDMDWSKYNDTVFEGHSMLELGLED